jgi:hypothetical protein
MEDERYIAAHVAAYPADTGNVLAFNRSTDRPEALSDQLFGILRRADRFDTIDGHIGRLFASGWEDDGSGFIESAFRELVSRGLLVSESTFRTSLLRAADGPQTPPPITAVGLPTRDRIPQVQRCLKSWIENNQRFDRHPSYFVFDDSRDDIHGELEKALAPLAAAGAPVFYAGVKEKARFAHELACEAKGDGLPEDVVSFALLGDEGFYYTYGANRNASLLAAPGEVFVTTDDDIVCQPAVPAEIPSALFLSSLNDPSVFRFYDNRKELSESVQTSDVDVLSFHEKLLGRTIAGCLSALGLDAALDVEGVSPETAHSLGRAGGVITLTATGHWGDCGMESPHLLLELNDSSRELLMRSRKHYAKAKESRETFRRVPGYTVSKSALFAGMNIGIDGRRLLPPFLPVGRNEDGMFAMALHLCVDDAFVGHLPLAIQHSPPGQRFYDPGPMPNAAPRFAEVISTIASGFRPPVARSGVSERLFDLGKLFVDVGSLKAGDFRSYVEQAWVSESSRYISYLEYLLAQHHGEPDYWAEDVQSFIERLTDFTVHGAPAAPRELLSSQSPEQAIETCRRGVRRFGQLLQWWPVIHSAAGALREKGIRLARPISISSSG